MDIKISYRHLASTEGIEAITLKKSEKLRKYFQGRFNLDWNFSVEKKNQIAHCHLTGPHFEFFAEASTDSIYTSIDDVILVLARKLHDRKEMVKNHHIPGAKALTRSVA